MSFMIGKSWNVESVKKIWFFIINICRIKFWMIFELMNATIFWFHFWNLINNDVQTCLSLIFFLFESSKCEKFSTILKFFLFFWFETDIFIIFFFDNYSRSRSLNFVCFFDFLFFLFENFLFKFVIALKQFSIELNLFRFRFLKFLLFEFLKRFLQKWTKFFSIFSILKIVFSTVFWLNISTFCRHNFFRIYSWKI